MRRHKGCLCTARGGFPSSSDPGDRGGGWVSQKTLAISVEFAEPLTGVRSSLSLAVTDSGESDYPGSIFVDDLLGTRFGFDKLLPHLASHVYSFDATVWLVD